ncbi:LysE family translocator [Pseudoroseomonas globiformis]|uniref:LysE family translocator n=1 Tax=Teichococcus globiformis TaxID=2307229 RepID=A0ABV7G7T9_9PROT
MQDPILFLLTVLAILGTPGPTNTLLATSGAASGWRRSLRLLPAEAAGYFISILFLGLVLGPVVAASPLISITLRVAVGAYLILLALRLWRQGSVLHGEAVAIRPRQVFVTTLLNPKALIFALGVVPFGSPHSWAYMAGFMGVLVVVGMSWIMAGAGLGQVAARASSGPRIIPRIGAAAIGTFAALILASPFMS